MLLVFIKSLTDSPLYFKLSHQHPLDQVNATLTIFFYNFSGGQHVFGIFGPNVDPGQHCLHGLSYFNFLSGQRVLGIFVPNVDPGQHRLHGHFY